MERRSFSLLLSVYLGSGPKELRRCLKSISEQSVLPAETVVVFDGPVVDGVHACISEQKDTLKIVTVSFEQNRGLGAALQDGLKFCSYELVARMDTDDICLPDRFSRQLEFLHTHPHISLVGGLLRERYVTRAGELCVERALPEDPAEVSRVARLRNPTNHPTVMFRKSDVIRAGGYLPFQLMEDYYLFARMLVAGMSIANIPQVFVEARPDEAFFRRRGGFYYIVQEIRLTRAFRRMGFHRLLDSVRFILIRAPYRILPARLRKTMYTLFLRR